MASRLEAVNLVVPRALLQSTRDFYEKKLGMQAVKVKALTLPQCASNDQVECNSFAFKKAPESVGVTLLSCLSVTRMIEASPDDIYWKIGLALEDVDVSGHVYQKNGGTWGGANQFLDVGYLGHTVDPAGFAIEFLQTTFKNSEEVRQQRSAVAGVGQPGAGPLGQKQDPVVGQITTRTSNPRKCVDFYTNMLGMKLLCIEPVTRYGFDLYFFGFTNETPPYPDQLTHVGNREWLYQRPYTTLEVQYVKGGTPSLNTDLPSDAGGFESISVVLEEKRYDGLKMTRKINEDGIIRDPDNMKVRVYKDERCERGSTTRGSKRLKSQ